jgi:hypothetical protein
METATEERGSVTMDRPRIPEAFRTTPEGAVVQARLDDLHAPVDAGLDRLALDALSADSATEALSTGRRSGRSVRVRIGRGIVALGSAVAGEEHRHTHGHAA